MDSGKEQILDQAELIQVRRQARSVNIQTAIYAAFLTEIFVAVSTLLGI